VIGRFVINGWRHFGLLIQAAHGKAARGKMGPGIGNEGLYSNEQEIQQAPPQYFTSKDNLKS